MVANNNISFKNYNCSDILFKKLRAINNKL